VAVAPILLIFLRIGNWRRPFCTGPRSYWTASCSFDAVHPHCKHCELLRCR